MAGDTIEAAVRAFYRQQATMQNNAGVPAEDMAASLMQALSLPQAAAASTHAANPQARLAEPRGGLTSNDLNDLKEKDPQNQREDKPKAYLNYVFFDNQFNFVEDGSGVKQVDADPNQLETLASGKVVAEKNGYVYVYTSNESQQDVLFDNMGVTDITGPVLEETHYYPFGLTMAGISTTAPLRLENRFKFNGKELNHKEFSDGAGLEWYNYGKRDFDPQIGRWEIIDPLVDSMPNYSPYNYAYDEPIRHIDVEGKYPIRIIYKIGEDTYKFTAPAAHLLSLVSGVSEEIISNASITSRHHFGDYRPWYDANQGGGAITLGNGIINNITYTENYFSDDPNSFSGNGFGRRPQEWLSISSHEVGHLAQIKKFGSRTSYLFEFIKQYTQSGNHDDAPFEKESDKGQIKFNNFNEFVNQHFGKNALLNLFSTANGTDDKTKIRLINAWWESYQKTQNN